MKKWIKGLIIAAVIMIGLGICICIVSVGVFGVRVPMGIFQHRWQNQSVTGKQLYLDDDYNDSDDFDDYYDSNEIYSDMINKNFRSDDVKSLDMEIGAAQVEISEEDSLEEITVNTDGGKFAVDLKSGVLNIKSDPKLMANNMNTVYVKIPKDFKFDEVDISAGASVVKIPRILARSLDVEIGAGEVNIEEFSAEEADFEIGAGKITVSDGSVGNCSADVGMGEFQYDGTISMKCDIECGMGNTVLNLEGNEEDYNYEIECSAGNVTIGEQDYSQVSEKFIDHHAKANMDIECSRGNVVITF